MVSQFDFILIETFCSYLLIKMLLPFVSGFFFSIKMVNTDWRSRLGQKKNLSDFMMVSTES